MGDSLFKEVYFHKYCRTCKYFRTEEDKDPCNECLNEPVNEYSHKPVNYVERTRGGKKK